MGIREAVGIIIGICVICVIVYCMILLISTDKSATRKLKKKIYFEYSYEDFREKIVAVHMKAVAEKDKKKEKKTLDCLLQLDEIYEFLDQELKIKH